MPRGSQLDIQRALRTVEARLNKAGKRGDPSRVLVPASAAGNSYFLRRPSGIMELDLHTGGGLPAGGLTYLSGPEGAGKTTLCYKYFAMHQKLYGKKASIGYAAVEGPPDQIRMRQTGMEVTVPEETLDAMNRSRVETGRPPLTKEESATLRSQTGNVSIVRHESAEKLLDAVTEMVSSKAFDIIAVDSVSALMPADEHNKDLMDNARMAASAMALTRFFAKYLQHTTGFHGENETTVIFVSQVRANKKKSEAAAHIAKYLRPWEAQGAWAAKHGKLIDVCVWSGGKEKVVVKTDGLDDRVVTHRVAISKTMHWEILKGKAGTHDGITGEVDYHYETPPFTDDIGDLMRVAQVRGIILTSKQDLLTVRRGPDGEVHDDMVDLTPDALRALLTQDFEAELRVRREVLGQAGISCLWR